MIILYIGMGVLGLLLFIIFLLWIKMLKKQNKERENKLNNIIKNDIQHFLKGYNFKNLNIEKEMYKEIKLRVTDHRKRRFEFCPSYRARTPKKINELKYVVISYIERDNNIHSKGYDYE